MLIRYQIQNLVPYILKHVILLIYQGDGRSGAIMSLAQTKVERLEGNNIVHMYFDIASSLAPIFVTNAQFIII